MKSLVKLKKIKGDASFREFYRNKENKSIVVISEKEKLKILKISFIKFKNITIKFYSMKLNFFVTGIHQRCCLNLKILNLKKI